MHSKTCYLPFLALFLIFLIAGANSKELNSDDPSNYWRTVTSNQPFPEALQALLKQDRAPEKTDDHLRGNFDKDSNGVPINYLRYKKDNHLNNNADPKVFTKTFQNHPNALNFNYLRYKKDNRPNNVYPKVSGNDHFTTTFQEEPNGMHLNYLRYKKANQMNGVDSEVPDPNYVHLNYLRYKKDSGRLNNVDPKVSGNDHFTTTFQEDPNGMHLNYLRYKKDNLNDIDPEVTGNHLTKTFQKDPNGVHFNYLRYKKDSGRLNNVDPKVSGTYADLDVSGDHFTKKFRNDPSGRLFRAYKKDVHFTKVFPNDPNSHHLNYYRYKKDDPLDKVEYGKLLVFTPADLNVGNKFLTMFPYVSTSSSDSQFASPKFLPRHVADSLPFSSAHLPDILRRFGIQPDSPWVEIMEETLKDCEAPGIKGETSFCATSLESMLDSARDTFGSNYDTKVISTTHLSETSNDGSADPRPQKYTILEVPKEIQAAKKMSCHPMSYLYPVFGCHIVKDSKLFRLLVEGEDGSKVDALAVCHMDTSDWSPGSLFLQAAGLKPGEGAVCHFMQPNHLAIFASSIGAATAL